LRLKICSQHTVSTNERERKRKIHNATTTSYPSPTSPPPAIQSSVLNVTLFGNPACARGEGTGSGPYTCWHDIGKWSGLGPCADVDHTARLRRHAARTSVRSLSTPMTFLAPRVCASQLRQNGRWEAGEGWEGTNLASDVSLVAPDVQYALLREYARWEEREPRVAREGSL
jgi:hypothetical protein